MHVADVVIPLPEKIQNEGVNVKVIHCESIGEKWLK